MLEYGKIYIVRRLKYVRSDNTPGSAPSHINNTTGGNKKQAPN